MRQSKLSPQQIKHGHDFHSHTEYRKTDLHADSLYPNTQLSSVKSQFLLCFVLFEVLPCGVAQAGLKPKVFLFPLPKCWDYRGIAPHRQGWHAPEHLGTASCTRKHGKPRTSEPQGLLIPEHTPCGFVKFPVLGGGGGEIQGGVTQACALEPVQHYVHTTVWGTLLAEEGDLGSTCILYVSHLHAEGEVDIGASLAPSFALVPVITQS